MLKKIEEILQKEGINIDFILKKDTMNVDRIQNSNINFNRAVNTILEDFYKKKFLVFFDVDLDGLIAGFIMYDFLKLSGVRNVDYYINEDRTHGVTEGLKDKAKDYDTIICVDSSTNDLGLTELLQQGKEVIIIDHHEIEQDNYRVLSKYENYILVSNKKPEVLEDYRHLSGAMIVYYTIVEICSKIGKNVPNKWLQLASLTLISDKCFLNNFNICILKNLYNTEYTKLCTIIKDVVDEFCLYKINSEDFRITSSFVDYVFAPLFNSILRFNRGETAIKVLIDYTYRKKVLHKLKLLTDKQNAITNILIQEGTLYTGNNYICMVDNLRTLNFNNTEVSNRNFAGLVASRLLDKGKLCAFYLVDMGDYYRGSFRGAKKLDYLNMLHSDDYKLLGHQRAFGVEIPKDKLNIFLERVEQSLKGVIVEEDYIEINQANLTQDLLKQVALINEYRLDKILFRLNYPRELIQVQIFDKYSKIKILNHEFLRFSTKQLENDYIMFHPSLKPLGYDLISIL